MLCAAPAIWLNTGPARTAAGEATELAAELAALRARNRLGAWADPAGALRDPAEALGRGLRFVAAHADFVALGVVTVCLRCLPPHLTRTQDAAAPAEAYLLPSPPPHPPPTRAGRSRTGMTRDLGPGLRPHRHRWRAGHELVHGRLHCHAAARGGGNLAPGRRPHRPLGVRPLPVEWQRHQLPSLARL